MDVSREPPHQSSGASSNWREGKLSPFYGLDTQRPEVREKIEKRGSTRQEWARTWPTDQVKKAWQDSGDATRGGNRAAVEGSEQR